MPSFQKGLLWKLDSGPQPPSYIFGTMHVRDERAFAWIEQLEPYIASAPFFYAEIDLEHLAEAPSLPILPGDDVLSSQVSPSRWERINRFCRRRYQLDLYSVEHLYPIMILQQITLYHLNEERQSVLDVELYQIAKKHQVQCGGIESLKEQMDLITGIPLELQVRYLINAIEHHRNFLSTLKRIISDYQNQNIYSVYKRTRKSLGKLRKPMLFERNRHMADRISQSCREEVPSFFCIGAAHLGGSKGVLRYLKQKGFRLTNVTL